MVYRLPPITELACPRCKTRKLPPTDVAECECGVWVTAYAASVVLSEQDVHPDPVTRWWRVREPCPACHEQMTLRGTDPGYLQGCDLHGFWIDADTIPHTKLGDGIDLAAIEAKRTNEEAQRADLERQQRAEQERDRKRLEQERQRQERERVQQLAKVRESEAHAAAIVNLLGPAGHALLARIARLEERNEQLEERVSELEARIPLGR